MTSAVVVRNVHKRFGATNAVAGISFSIEPGEVFGLLGPNGAGKTTTVRMIATLLQPSEGELWVCGTRAGTDDARIRARVGLLTEAPGLYDRLSAWDNLDYAAQLYGVGHAARPGRVEAWLARFGLADRAGDKVATFSKGMRQKLAIARALIHEPPVLLLDEPTSGLDPEASADVREAIRGLAGGGRAVLLCTHRLEEAEKLCRRAAVMDEGRIVSILDVAGGRPPVLIALAQAPSPRQIDQVRAVLGVQAAWPANGGLELSLSPDADAVPEVVAALVASGARVRGVHERHNRLEEVYLSLMKASA